MRRLLFWIHLCAGVVAGSIILVMSFTGVILAYEKQIIQWAEKGNRATGAEMASSRLPAADIVVKAIEASGSDAPPSTFQLRRDPAEPVGISWGRDRTLFVNPYTGVVIGEGSGVRSFMQTVVEWHRWLGNREHGRKITGACNLAFIVLIITGFILWCPRRWPWQWSWRSLKGGVAIDRRASGQARDWNWHRVVGFWCAPLLLFLSVTGTIWSYQWANNLIYTLSGSEVPPPRGGPAGPGGRGGREIEKPPAFVPVALEPYIDSAARQLPTWQTISLSLPMGKAKSVNVTVSERFPWHPYARSSMKLAVGSAEVTEWKPFMEQSLGARIRGTWRPLHTGEAGGIVGQTLAAVAAAGGCLLVWTGIALSLRRLGRTLRRRKDKASEPVAPVS